jgi:hypothetical protein
MTRARTAPFVTLQFAPVPMLMLPSTAPTGAAGAGTEDDAAC